LIVIPHNTVARYLARTHGWLSSLLRAKKPLENLSCGDLKPVVQKVSIELPDRQLMSFNELIAIPEQYFRRLILDRDSLDLMISAIGNDPAMFKTVSNIYAIYRINNALSELTEEQKILAELIFEFMPNLEGK
jgi:hypothetical protein